MDDPNHVLQVITIRYCSRNVKQFADVTNFFQATDAGRNQFGYRLNLSGNILEVDDPELKVPGYFLCQVYRPDMRAWLKAITEYSRRYPEVAFQLGLYWYASNFYTVNLQNGVLLETREYNPSNCDSCWEKDDGCEKTCQWAKNDRTFKLNGTKIVPNAEQLEQAWKWASEMPIMFMESKESKGQANI